MKLSEDLTWRGLIKDKTFADTSYLDDPKKFYLGVDCSADSLTIGNLAVFVLARRLRRAGWQAVLLVGGATSLIGDPGGKDEERPLKSRDEIERNVAAIKRQVQRLFEGEDFELVDNYDWFKDMTYLGFLRDVGKHYSLTELVQRDFISDRMGEGGGGISYAEFSYTLIQGYDYWYLNAHHGVELQIGGSDQWGNMLSGVPLIRKKAGKEVHAMSMPLVTNKLTGRKFGKSEEGAVWLDTAKTPEHAFRQFWINVEDANVEDYLKIYTDLSRTEIEQLMAAHREKPEYRVAQNELSDQVAKLVYGEFSAEAAKQIDDLLRSQTIPPDISADLLKQFRSDFGATTAQPGGSIVAALCETGLASSNTEARRLIANGGIYINGQTADREFFKPEDFHNKRLLLRRGKAFKDSALVECN